MPNPRKPSLEDAMKAVQERYGPEAIIKMDGKARSGIETFPSGSPSLDDALGGGYPRGRIIEVFGPEASGKTTMALHAAAGAQAQGGAVAFVDAEHTLDFEYAEALGVKIPDLLMVQPNNGEEALETVDILVRSGALHLIIVDSVAALVPQAELEGEMQDLQVGLQARMMSKALRKLTGVVSKSRTTLFFINQLRMKIGQSYGNPEVTAGGKALGFYATIRLNVRRIKAIKDGERTVGARTRVTVAKNKIAPPYGRVEFDLIAGQGISREGDLIELALAKGVLQKSGAWYSFGEERVGQGREATRLRLREDKKLAKKVEDALRGK